MVVILQPFSHILSIILLKIHQKDASKCIFQLLRKKISFKICTFVPAIQQFIKKNQEFYNVYDNIEQHNNPIVLSEHSTL